MCLKPHVIAVKREKSCARAGVFMRGETIAGPLRHWEDLRDSWRERPGEGEAAWSEVRQSLVEREPASEQAWTDAMWDTERAESLKRMRVYK